MGLPAALAQPAHPRGRTAFSHACGILAAAPGLVRLRISSLEETEITPELIHLIKSEPRMAKHLHIPLQSGSSKVLRRMNRRYDTDAFLAKLDEIRREIPLLAITFCNLSIYYQL